jgi:hypothetical protein
MVKVLTGERYCFDHQIEKIDFLKIDAEGHDLAVLMGFRGMLAEKKIEFIQAECTPDSRNNYHVSLEKISSFLQFFGYSLFALSDLVYFDNENRVSTRSIWYCNAVFVNS